MKYLYRFLLVGAVALMFYADIEKKGSFDITETPTEEEASLLKKGSFDLTSDGKDPEVPVSPNLAGGKDPEVPTLPG